MAFRILIVDDDAGFLGLAAELLAERGFDVLGKAMDSAQALAAAIEERPDGILLDINLPGRDGFATAAALSEACPSARIVLTYADVQQVAAEVLQGCSVDAFVPKEEFATTDLAVIPRAALGHRDPVCVRALDLMVSIYGAEAGNLALKYYAAGGVYVGGGIAPQILPKLRDGAFLRSFTAKGRSLRPRRRARHDGCVMALAQRCHNGKPCFVDPPAHPTGGTATITRTSAGISTWSH